MKHIFLFLFLITISFISCDGRDRAFKSNQDVLRDNKLLDSFSEQIKFFPEHYTEIITDTILSTGFRVKIKYFSLENDFVLKTYKSKNDSLIKHHYKNFEAQFQVLKNNTIIKERTINKSLFSKFDDSEFWNKAIMQFVWFDDGSSVKNGVNINVSFCIPDTEICKDFTLFISENKAIQIKKIELTNNNL